MNRISNKKRYLSKFLLPFIFSAEFALAFLNIAFGMPLIVYGLFSVSGILFTVFLNSGLH